MDALFIPLAGLVGASVDQIKVRAVSSLTSPLTYREYMTAHNMSPDSVPVGQFVHSYTLHIPTPQTLVQHWRVHVLSPRCFQPVARLPAASC